MSVAFDHQIFSLQTYGGISRYFAEVAARLDGRPDCEIAVLAWAHRNAYLRDLRPGLVRGRYVRPWPRTVRLRGWINGALSARWVRRHQPRVVHETYYAAAAPGRDRAARCRVVTVYDMIHERLPQFFPPGDPTAAAKAAAVRRADHVICISRRTRDDLLDLVGVPQERVSVVHLGCTPPRERPAAPGVPGPYLLYVGERGGYKNFKGLADAYAASRLSRAGIRLVCAGGGPLSPDEWAALVAAGIRTADVTWLAADDTLLGSLYAHAACFAYPSLYEGFGIPPLEAMAHGCPVVCSDAGSLPEVVADAALLVPPTDRDALVHALERAACDTALADELRVRGRARAALFSWQRTADASYATYRALC